MRYVNQKSFESIKSVQALNVNGLTRIGPLNSLKILKFRNVITAMTSSPLTEHKYL